MVPCDYVSREDRDKNFACSGTVTGRQAKLFRDSSQIAPTLPSGLVELGHHVARSL